MHAMDEGMNPKTNETLLSILRRRSVRSYRKDQIADDELRAILEAGRYAPNAGNEAWHFTAVQNRDLLRRLNLAAKEGARQSGIPHLAELGSGGRFDCLYAAPTLVIVSGDASAPMPLDADCAAATQNMLIAAQSLGVGSCWIYFVLMAFQSSQGEALRRELQIPEGYRPYDAAVFGYKIEDVVDVPERKHGLITIIR